MNKTGVLGAIAGLALIAILFTPIDTDLWAYFLMLGIIFGALWFRRLD